MDIVGRTFGLAGHVAVITGASGGLGEHFAETLHGAGATVVLIARRAERLDALAARLGERTLVVVADLSAAEAPVQVVRRTLGEFGRIDVLVNCAGISNPGQPTALEESPEAFADILGVNARATFALCREAGKPMLHNGSGSIVNVGSIIGQSAVPSDVAYAASKGAVASMTRALAVQWARRGVRVNCLAPGFFPTEMNTELFEDDAGLTWMRRRCPAGRAGRLEELDAALLFLCSPTSAFCTGQTIAVDGGWTIG